MPSQFRFFASSPKPADVNGEPSANGDPSTNGAQNANATSLFRSIRNATTAEQRPIESSGANPESPTAETEPQDENSTVSGLHDVIKNTDYWFNYELSLLEKYAVEQAVEWAKSGIPRQDAPLEGELPIDTILKARATEIFQEWFARVKRKVQDSIQSAYAHAGDKIVQFRHVFTQLQRNTVEINTTENNIREREEALRSQQKTFGAAALLNRRVYHRALCRVGNH